MPLVDASAFIDAHGRDADPHVERCRAYLRGVGQAQRLRVAAISAQEVLAGARDEANADRLERELRAFDLVLATVQDHVEAARLYRGCRAAGVSAGHVDALVVVLARRLGEPVFATDVDFEHIQRVTSFPLVCFARGRSSGD